MSAFAQAIEAMFSDPNVSFAANYTPPGGGTPTPCRVRKIGADKRIGGVDGQPFTDTTTIKVRKSEVAAPAEYGVFVIDGPEGGTFTIMGDPQLLDGRQSVWTCTV